MPYHGTIVLWMLMLFGLALGVATLEIQPSLPLKDASLLRRSTAVSLSRRGLPFGPLLSHFIAPAPSLTSQSLPSSRNPSLTPSSLDSQDTPPSDNAPSRTSSRTRTAEQIRNQHAFHTFKNADNRQLIIARLRSDDPFYKAVEAEAQRRATKTARREVRLRHQLDRAHTTAPSHSHDDASGISEEGKSPSERQQQVESPSEHSPPSVSPSEHGEASRHPRLHRHGSNENADRSTSSLDSPSRPVSSQLTSSSQSPSFNIEQDLQQKLHAAISRAETARLDLAYIRDLRPRAASDGGGSPAFHSADMRNPV